MKQDKQRQWAAIYTAPTFEGVSVRVGGVNRMQASRSYLRTVLAVLRSVIVSAAQPLHRQPGRI